MDEKEYSIGRIGDVFDEHNIASGDSTMYEEIKIEEIAVTSSMKIMFIVFGLIGAGYSLYAFGFFQFLIWVLALMFVSDMLGIFDTLRDWLRESQKPRGGYDSIG